jgi:hypothetical protein
MNVFISRGQYLVLNEERDFIGSIFSNLVQAVAYCRNHGKQPVYMWEV